MVLAVTLEIIKGNVSGAYTIVAAPELAGCIASSGPHSRIVNFRVPKRNVLAAPGKGA